MSGEAPESGEGLPPASGADARAPHTSGHGPSHGLPIRFTFIEQVKRRNVGRVAILYIVVCYLILESLSIFVHVLALPEWIGRTVTVLMALGFPAALVFAWVYEITPDGLKPTIEVEPSQSIRKHTGQRLDRAIIVTLSIALAYFVVDKFWLSKHVTTEQPVSAVAPATAPAATAISERSVAVLPFVDMSERKDQEYFSDGLSEELIDMLTKVGELRVPARTSSFYFKGKQATIADIAKVLGVAHVLEGSVRKSGNTLRITTQLVRVDNGYHVWSETYDRKLDDIFKIQDEIAAAVVKALSVSLLGAGTARAAPTSNSEAYTLYLQAQSLAKRDTSEDTLRAHDYLKQALGLESKQFRKLLANKANTIGTVAAYPSAYPI